MVRVEILVEELSMKEFLKILLPKILDEFWVLNHNYFIRSFEGKNDLQKNIPTKIKVLSNWNYEKTGVIIMQDQDSSDCKVLKQKIVKMCDDNGNCPKLIRIICRELESWYLGDFVALHKAYPKFRYQNYIEASKYRNPELCNASYEIKKLIPEFQKVNGAKKIANFINIEKNKSESFHQTMNGINLFLESLKNDN